jgi:lycopene cyclase domain-containing protein
MESYFYLLTILIFAGSIILLEWSVEAKYLIKHIRLLALIVLISILYAFPAESAALGWKIWQYTPKKFTGIFLGGPPAEIVIFAVFVSLAISGALLIFARYEEKEKPVLRSVRRDLAQAAKKSEEIVEEDIRQTKKDFDKLKS